MEGKAALASSVTISDVAQNRSGELTHPMGRMRSIQKRGSGSKGIERTT